MVYYYVYMAIKKKARGWGEGERGGGGGGVVLCHTFKTLALGNFLTFGLNISYSSHGMIKDCSERKAMFNPIHLEDGRGG